MRMSGAWERTQQPSRGDFLRRVLAGLLALALVWVAPAQAARTVVKPGWNLYSPDDDVNIGKQVSQKAEQELPLLNDRRVDDYLNRLGRRLADKAPGPRFPYQFKAVNDKSINAFALPGGFMYVHRGVIEAAANEAQLAGVMGHEIGHVALRHGTSQASKAAATQIGAGLLGGLLGGGGSLAGLTAQLVAGFSANSLLLKFSRDAERQADIIGTQILYDTTMDPRAMAQFFEKLAAESKGKRPPEFFSSHPNPENRTEKVTAEVEKLGGPPARYRNDSEEFREIKRYMATLPAAGKRGSGGGGGSGGTASTGKPAPPSERFRSFKNDHIQISYPENWQKGGQGDFVAFFPERGVVQDAQGNQGLAYGAQVNLFEAHADRSGPLTVEEATDQLIEELRRPNPRLRVTRGHDRIRIGGVRGLSTFLSNDSPVGGRETDWLLTFMRPEGLLYFVFVAPEKDYDAYEAAFQGMADSIRFVNVRR